jgi:hypothetical protein
MAACPASRTKGLIKKHEQDQAAVQHATGSAGLGFLFAWQGSQCYAMGCELIETYTAVLLEAEQHLQGRGARVAQRFSFNRSAFRDSNS